MHMYSTIALFALHNKILHRISFAHHNKKIEWRIKANLSLELSTPGFRVISPVHYKQLSGKKNSLQRDGIVLTVQQLALNCQLFLWDDIFAILRDITRITKNLICEILKNGWTISSFNPWKFLVHENYWLYDM